ncbi:hypothetical protein [Pantoea vagans]|uniref:hypothetical protein n=1 Tax=Pantoea vagans TaxID=470934 RepID=UPI000ABA7A66|nr:hypothetical protein [Pantoea vagans]
MRNSLGGHERAHCRSADAASQTCRKVMTGCTVLVQWKRIAPHEGLPGLQESIKEQTENVTAISRISYRWRFLKTKKQLLPSPVTEEGNAC